MGSKRPALNKSIPSYVIAERERILQEYQDRKKRIPVDRYAPWQMAEFFMKIHRLRKAMKLLKKMNVFPIPGDRILEVGCGRLGWLADCLNWGLYETDLHGIDLDPERVEEARKRFPSADLRVGDATSLPWSDEHFHLVIASTVFTSILDDRVRRMVAREIVRVLAPGGALLWYDYCFNNPSNPAVRKVTKRELKQLFPDLRGIIKRVTLAPPITRAMVPLSWMMAELIQVFPFLRTHYLALLIKK